MANIAIFRINYKSDFILTLNSDAGWMTPFCIKFWTGAPSQAYFVGYDGTTYTHCAPVDGEPTKLAVQFDDHHLPIGDLKFQIGYHFTVADFPTSVEDEVLNQTSVIIEVDDAPAQVMLDLNGETAPEIEFSLPAYANEAQRIANEQQRIANEEQRISAEQQRINNEETRISREQTRQDNEAQRINQEQARVNEFAVLKRESEQATTDANNAAENARQKAQLAQDKAALAQAAAQLANDKAAMAQAAAQLANDKAQLAADKAALAQAASQLCDEKATLAQQKATYAQQQGDYSKAQGDYAKEQGDYSKAQGDYSKEQGDYSKEQGDYAKDKGDICADDHQTAVADHQTATADHQTAAADHQTATADHNQAGNDHTRAESDHTRAESDHAAVEVYVDSLGAFDISAYNATGGVLAKYADLTAALGTNGANIPDALRKGGMSVKFVQSSDNKYVQYRLMANAFTTDVTQWQTVDDEPTANSENLVKSGGVAKTFDEELGNVILGKAIDENGDEVDAEGYLCSKKIPVNPGDTLVYTSGASATINYYTVLYKADGSKLKAYKGVTGDRTIEVSSSSSVAYCRATFVAGGNYDLKVNGVSSMHKGIKDDIGRLDSKVDALSGNVNELSVATQSKIDAIKFNELIGNIIYGKGVSASTGSLVDNEDVFMTDKIPAAEGDVIVYNAGKSLTADSLGLVAFNSSDVRLTGYSGLSGDRNYTMPANTAYIRATFAKGSGAIKLTKNGDNVIVNGLMDNTIYLSQFNRDKIELLNLLSNNKLGNIIEGIGINGVNDVVYEDSELVSTMLIPASEGQKVNYLAGASISPASLVVYDHNGIKIERWAGTLSTRSLDMPANTAYIAASFKKGTNYSLTIDRNDGEGYVDVLNEGELSAIAAAVAEHSEAIDSQQEEIDAIRSNLIVGKAVLSDGSIVTDADMVATEKISCKHDDAVIYKGGSSILSTNQYSLVAYNASDVKINNWRGTASERSFSIPNNTAYIRATFAIGTDFSLTINGNDVIFNKELNNVILKDAEQDKRLNLLELSASDRGHLMPINAFGDILPAAFKAKYMSMENDLLIACQGDSLTGLIEKCDVQEEPEHCPPGCQYKSWIYLLQQNLSKKKPVCDRVDSQRDNVDVFTKTGTWENVVEIGRTEIYASDGTIGQQRTISALTFQCADNNAALSFEFDADVYEKCNIVYSKEPDGVLTKIVINEGDGKMLVSEDRTTWVEANNYQCSQRTFDEVTETGGNANRECHRRLWMKKASGNVSGVLHITYQRDNSTQYADSYMYVWGIEKWSDCAVFIDNLGRGGRNTKILKANISDIFDRHPDLAIYEMPLANEISTEGTCQTRATLKGSDYYGGYFLGNGNDSFKTRSNNYADLPLIVVLPHGRANYFDDNNNAVRLSNSPAGEPNVYTCAKQMYTWLMGQLSTYSNVAFVNLYDVLISEALVLDDKINRGFYGAAKAITADGTENSVHLSQYGAYLWAKYLTGLFLMD